jgi:hypothetical protein
VALPDVYDENAWTGATSLGQKTFAHGRAAMG